MNVSKTRESLNKSFDRSTSSRLRANGRWLIPLPDLRFVVSPSTALRRALSNHEWNQLIQKFPRFAGVVLFALHLVGCAIPVEPDPNAPIAEPIASNQAPPRANSRQPARYAVVSGDTLHSIASRFRLNPLELARWNRLQAPYNLRPGQILELSDPAVTGLAQTQSPAGNSTRVIESNSSRRRPVRAPTAETPGSTARNGRGAGSESLAVGTANAVASPSDKSKAVTSGIAWQWPATGRVIKADASVGKKGLEIWGAPGQAVKAAADGLIVYSGAGVDGFGQLIIVKHSASYLSAYAHNRKLLAAEGVRVHAGQKIAEMGGPNDRDVKLYFEIRRNGKPVDPLLYLPKT